MAHFTDDILQQARSWPFEEAKRILKKCRGQTPEKGYILFETGYGPSGLPHIGTFGEVLRTSMVRHAFEQLSDIPTKLFCFSDDMDGLRKVPDNVPNHHILHQALGLPLTQVPDPFGQYDSFGAHNNAKLQEFLDQFNFDYIFKSATQCYQDGVFNDTLKLYCDHYDDIMAVMLPSLGAERRADYSPFMPICPDTGHVLMVNILEVDTSNYTLSYKYNNKDYTVSILDGHCKLQWKPDWSMRWAHFGVDYEMAGKDLIPSADLACKILKKCAKPAPTIFHYELFLDDKGEKISKSKGNGISMDEWLRYAPKESLAYYMYQKPKTAKRLFFDVIPKNVDEYYHELQQYHHLEPPKACDNAIMHLHQNAVPSNNVIPVNYTMLINLVSASNADNAAILWGFLQHYDTTITPEQYPALNPLIEHALHYYHDFVYPNKNYKILNHDEQLIIEHIRQSLHDNFSQEPQHNQQIIYDIGKEYGYNIKEFFALLYQALLGQPNGPRLGSLFTLLGKDESLKLLDNALNRL